MKVHCPRPFRIETAFVKANLDDYALTIYMGKVNIMISVQASELTCFLLFSATKLSWQSGTQQLTKMGIILAQNQGI